MVASLTSRSRQHHHLVPHVLRTLTHSCIWPTLKCELNFRLKRRAQQLASVNPANYTPINLLVADDNCSLFCLSTHPRVFKGETQKQQVVLAVTIIINGYFTPETADEVIPIAMMMTISRTNLIRGLWEGRYQWRRSGCRDLADGRLAVDDARLSEQRPSCIIYFHPGSHDGWWIA